MTTPPPDPPKQPYNPPPGTPQQPNPPYDPPSGAPGAGYGGGYAAPGPEGFGAPPWPTGPGAPGGYPAQQPPPGYGPPGPPVPGPGFGPPGPPNRRRSPLLITSVVVLALLVVLGGGFGWPGWFTGSDTDSSSPGSVAESFADAVNHRDSEAAINLWCETSEEFTEDLDNSDVTTHISLANQPHVEGDTATQQANITVSRDGHTSRNTVTMKLSKSEDGQWCVAGFAAGSQPEINGTGAVPGPTAGAPTPSTGTALDSGEEAASALIEAINDGDSDAAQALVCDGKPDAASAVNEMLSHAGHAEITGSGGPETPLTVAYIAEVTNDEEGKVWKYWVTFSKDDNFCLMDVTSDGSSDTVPGATLTAQAKQVMQKVVNAVNNGDTTTAASLVCPDATLGTKDNLDNMIGYGYQMTTFSVRGKIEGAVDFEYSYRRPSLNNTIRDGLATINRHNETSWCLYDFSAP